MNEGKVPQEWKWANVTPIFKKGSKLSPGNYQPVSLTCIICKIKESVIKDFVVEHLTLNELATILSKFADDTKTGRAVNNDKDHQLLQESLDILVKWAEDW